LDTLPKQLSLNALRDWHKNRGAIFGKPLTDNDLLVVLGVIPVVDVLGLLEVDEGDPVLQVTDFVANGNLIGNG